ncbi:MAG: aminopeptidase P family protein [Bacteroidaceae bacterium]|nr:aminopeptidase P family protein [Bacteroidaceae bacterium]
MNAEITQRVERLRQWMRQQGIHAFITPSTDPHSGEYVPNHWHSREWISGFNGSAGTAVVTLDDAALWTDNRYFLAAAEQLDGTPFTLQKLGLEGTPSIAQWLSQKYNVQSTKYKEGAEKWKVGIDGTCFTVAEAEQLERELGTSYFALCTCPDPYDDIWTDRPAIPQNLVELHSVDYAGEDVASKLGRIREEVKKQGAAAVVISMLDEVAWALNLRGTDVDYNPVFVSYLVVETSRARVYINKEKLTTEVADYLRRNDIETAPYEQIFSDLQSLDVPALIQPDKTNVQVKQSLKQAVMGTCPVTVMKIMKNETERRGYHSAMLKDGIAMVKWTKWALEAIPQGGQTELSLSAKLESFRAEQPLFRGVSFETIMGYGPHAAIVHYEPSEATDVAVEPHGLLLCDSGGQYLDGTTDITRTLPCGPLTWEERRDYTLCLRGWIRLASAVFPRGTYGSQLDCLAREPMWRYGINYLHGTGHGVGQYLCVHEGPHQFRMNYMPQPLVPDMTITCEPGIYIAGSHGVRHENTMLVVDAQLRECEGSEGRTFGPYYQFEQLTLCPILTEPIVRELMQPEEIAWFNEYQQTVYDKLAPHLDEEHRQWLYDVTRPI